MFFLEKQIFHFLQKNPERLAIICLNGPVGSGKTHWARQFLRRYFDSPSLVVPSPTYLIERRYGGGGRTAVHADFYRLEGLAAEAEALLDLAERGDDELPAASVLLLEWPDVAAGWLRRRGHLSIGLEVGEVGAEAGEETRAYWARANGMEWEEALSFV